MKKILFLIFALSVCIGTIHADIIFTLGNNPQPGEENILLNGGTGTTVMGAPNAARTLFGASQGQR
jgi:hypothetical protein